MGARGAYRPKLALSGSGSGPERNATLGARGRRAVAVCHYMIQTLVELYGGCMVVLKVRTAPAPTACFFNAETFCAISCSCSPSRSRSRCDAAIAWAEPSTALAPR